MKKPEFLGGIAQHSMDNPEKNAINGLTEFLRLERKRVPGRILSEADRLECLFFGGFDPHFEGDEPPGL